MSTATTLQFKRHKLGVITPVRPSNKPRILPPNLSPSPDTGLRLFHPRSVALSSDASSSQAPISARNPAITFRRHIKFCGVEELNECQIYESVVLLDALENGEDGASVGDPRSPYRSATSSDDTPNSITDELTAVPEPEQIQKELRRLSEHSSSINNENIALTLPSTPNPPEKGKICRENGVAATGSQQRVLAEPNKTEIPVIGSQAGASGSEASITNCTEGAATNDCLSPSTNGISRKRVLSDRGEQENQFPIIDRNSMFFAWNGCPKLAFGRDCGTGLHNPMNNCFLNSVLQAVVHTPHLARMVLESSDERMCTGQQQQQGCFHCGLKGHIHRAITLQHTINTNWINPHLKRIFPHHRPGTQEDAHEMLTLLLSALEPLPPKKPNLKVHGTQGPGPSTPIEQIFGGCLRNKIVCNACSHEHINYERIREINLGLTRNSATNVEELIQDFFRSEQISNFICSRCKQKRNATRHTYLLRAPTVLIIQLKRFNIYGGKNRLTVRPKVHLDLSRYAQQDLFPPHKESILYQLYGLIEHIGGGINFGHYICAMRGFKGGWYRFDDSDKRSISPSDLLNNMDPYILFYSKVSPPIQRRSVGGYPHSAAKQTRFSNNYNSSGMNRLNHTFSSYNSCNN